MEEREEGLRPESAELVTDETPEQTTKQSKTLYKQLISHGIPKNVAQKILELYEG